MTIQPAARTPLRRAVVIGALGVVFGDIGTSPIYTLPRMSQIVGQCRELGSSGPPFAGVLGADGRRHNQIRLLCQARRQ
jgi:hypothetical protein